MHNGMIDLYSILTSLFRYLLNWALQDCFDSVPFYGLLISLIYSELAARLSWSLEFSSFTLMLSSPFLFSGGGMRLSLIEGLSNFGVSRSAFELLHVSIVINGAEGSVSLLTS